MSVLFLSSDLVFSSRLAAAGNRIGVPVSAVSSIDAAAARISSGPIQLVVIDLSQASLDVEMAVSELRKARAGLAIVAYAPHVHEQRLRGAAEAGCNEVFTRGQFDRQMEEILARYVAK